MNAEPKEINSKADDDAHAAASQDGPRIGGPIILVGDRSGFGVHIVPPWSDFTTYTEALQVDSVNMICASVDTVNDMAIHCRRAPRSASTLSHLVRWRHQPCFDPHAALL
jgi:hypothetical protein